MNHKFKLFTLAAIAAFVSSQTLAATTYQVHCPNEIISPTNLVYAANLTDEEAKPYLKPGFWVQSSGGRALSSHPSISFNYAYYDTYLCNPSDGNSINCIYTDHNNNFILSIGIAPEINDQGETTAPFFTNCAINKDGRSFTCTQPDGTHTKK